MEKETEKKTFLNYNKDFHKQMEDMKDNNDYFPNSFRDVFILGMCYAAKKSLKPQDLEEGKKQFTIRILEVINPDHKFLFQVLAYFYTKDYKTIAEEIGFFELAEKFANVGLKEVIDKFYKTDYPSFELAEIALEDDHE